MGFVLPAKFICKANNENANARKIKYISPRREESNSPNVSGIDTLPRISRKTLKERMLMTSPAAQGPKGMRKGEESELGGNTIGTTNVTGDHTTLQRDSHMQRRMRRGRLQGRAENATPRKDEEHDMTVQLKMAVQVSSGCQVSVRQGWREKEKERDKEEKAWKRGACREWPLTGPAKRPRRER